MTTAVTTPTTAAVQYMYVVTDSCPSRHILNQPMLNNSQHMPDCTFQLRIELQVAPGSPDMLRPTHMHLVPPCSAAHMQMLHAACEGTDCACSVQQTLREITQPTTKSAATPLTQAQQTLQLPNAVHTAADA